MGREGKYSLAESNSYSFSASISVTASFLDTIIGILIDGAAKRGGGG